MSRLVAPAGDKRFLITEYGSGKSALQVGDTEVYEPVNINSQVAVRPTQSRIHLLDPDQAVTSLDIQPGNQISYFTVKNNGDNVMTDLLLNFTKPARAADDGRPVEGWGLLHVEKIVFRANNRVVQTVFWSEIYDWVMTRLDQNKYASVAGMMGIGLSESERDAQNLRTRNFTIPLMLFFSSMRGDDLALTLTEDEYDVRVHWNPPSYFQQNVIGNDTTSAYTLTNISLVQRSALTSAQSHQDRMEKIYSSGLAIPKVHTRRVTEDLAQSETGKAIADSQKVQLTNLPNGNNCFHMTVRGFWASNVRYNTNGVDGLYQNPSNAVPLILQLLRNGSDIVETKDTRIHDENGIYSLHHALELDEAFPTAQAGEWAYVARFFFAHPRLIRLIPTKGRLGGAVIDNRKWSLRVCFNPSTAVGAAGTEAALSQCAAADSPTGAAVDVPILEIMVYSYDFVLQTPRQLKADIDDQ